jgi:hypothetical protein
MLLRRLLRFVYNLEDPFLYTVIGKNGFSTAIFLGLSWFIQRKVTQTFFFGRGGVIFKFLSLIIYLSRVLCLPSVVEHCCMLYVSL